MDKETLERLKKTATAGEVEQLTEELIARVDAHVPSPRDNAEKVWAALQKQDFTEYEILCFAAEWLGRMAVGVLNNNDLFVSIVKGLNKWLYNAHYFHAEEIFGERARSSVVRNSPRDEGSMGIRQGSRTDDPNRPKESTSDGPSPWSRGEDTLEGRDDPE